MSKLIMSLGIILFSFASEPKQSNEDSNTRICYYSYVSGHYGVQIKNKMNVATGYSITWPDGYTGNNYPAICAGGVGYAYHTAAFQVGNLSVTPTVNGGKVAVYVASQLGHTKCN